MHVRLQQLDWRVAVELGLAIAFGLGFVAAIGYLAVPLAILILSITIASALSPLVEWLQRWLPRAVAVALVYLVLLLLLGLAGWFLLPVLFRQVQDVLNRVPSLIALIQRQRQRWDLGTDIQLSDLLSMAASNLSATVFSLPLRIASSLLEILITFFLSFYWLLAAPGFSASIRSLFPEHQHRRVNHVLASMSREMGGYVRGSAINALIVGMLAGLGLYLAGINYPLVLGTITAFGELIPYIGPIVAAIPAVGVGLLQSPWKAILALIVYVAIKQIEGHVLTPNIMRSQTDVPQALVIFALLAGGSIGGILGALVAIPLAGVLRVLMQELIAPAIRRWLDPEPQSQASHEGS